MTSKAYTSVAQSKELVELGLDINTADMCWEQIYDEDHLMSDYRISLTPYKLYSGIGIPAWSLAALLEMIPHTDFNGIELSNYCIKGRHIWTASGHWGLDSPIRLEDSPIDAICNMIPYLLMTNKIIPTNNDKRTNS